MSDIELTAEIVRELLDYNPNTGDLFWKKRPLKYFKNKHDRDKWNGRWAGKEAFTAIYRNKTGRIGRKQGKILRKIYLAHRIIWLHYYGCLPKNQIDHINHNTTDNRIINLREVTHSENNRNRTLQSNNKVGYNGVCYDKNRNRYMAHITINNVTKDLGRYATLEEAVEARRVANIKYNFHANHGAERND